MTKQEAIRIFGSQTALADALGCRVQNITHWPNEPEPLKQWQVDRVVGAAVRLGKDVPRAEKTAA